MLKYNNIFEAVENEDIDAVEEILNMFKLQKMNEDDKIYLLLKNSFLFDDDCDYNYIWLDIYSYVNEDIDIDSLLYYSKHMMCNKTNSLILAIDRERTDIVKTLIDAKADVNIQYEGGYSALIKAIHKENTDIAKTLIEVGAELNIQDEYGYSALMWASRKGYTNIAQMLIDAGANLNIQDYGGNSALMLATRNGYTNIVQMLIDAKADLNIKDRHGTTAISLATRNGHTYIAKMLIENGACMWMGKRIQRR